MRDSTVFEENKMSTENEQFRLHGNDVVHWFSLSFSQTLLHKLKELEVEDKIFDKGEECARGEMMQHQGVSSITLIASCVISHLCSQIKYPIKITSATPIMIQRLIE